MQHTQTWTCVTLRIMHASTHTHALTPTAEAYPQFNATQYANTGFMCQ